MTAHRRAVLLALLVLATSACGDDHERLLKGWERDGRGVSESEIRTDAGATHCEWDDALILGLVWPLDGDGSGGAWHSYVRDPEGVMADYSAGSFDDDAELPGDAVATGYEHDAAGELWLADDLATAYLVDGDAVEAWPTVGGALCA